MTTNGLHLAKMAEELKKSGLKRVNISLDSLKSEKFAYITGGGKLEGVLEGIKRAVEVGLTPVKVNTVLIKGINDDEIEDLIALARDNPIEVRFIELMPIGSFGEQNMDKIIYNDEIIATHPELVRCSDDNDSEPSRYYTVNGYQGRIGFISPMSHKFCNSCNRIRLTCDGKIKPCLGNNREMDMMKVLRGNRDELDEVVRKVIYEKPQGHHFGKRFKSNRKMNMIGG
jgi:GTP 3',8-cyclase